MRKTIRKEKKKHLKKSAQMQQRQKERQQSINELRIYQQSKNQDIQTEMSKKRTMFSLQ